MNVVLLGDKKTRKSFETAVKSEPDINLIGAEMVIRGNTMSRIADFHNPHLLVVYRSVPAKDGITADDVISFLRMKRPAMRIVYVYGEITEHEDFISKANELMQNGITDIVTDGSVIDVINTPMTEEDVQNRISELKASETSEQFVIDEDVSDISYEKIDLDFPAVTAKTEFDIDNVLFISDNTEEMETMNIGIAQLQHHNGCTHTSLEIALMLNKKNSVAVIFADDDTYERLAVYHRINPLSAQDGLNYNGIDIYPYSKRNALEGYNVIICDYGYLKEEQKKAFEESDVKIMLTSAAEWDISTLIKHVEYSDNSYIQNIHILIPRVTQSKFIKYNKRFLKSGVKAFRLHNSPDWTSPNVDNIATYKILLSPYKLLPAEKKAKKKLFRVK